MPCAARASRFPSEGQRPGLSFSANLVAVRLAPGECRSHSGLRSAAAGPASRQRMHFRASGNIARHRPHRPALSGCLYPIPKDGTKGVSRRQKRLKERIFRDIDHILETGRTAAAAGAYRTRARRLLCRRPRFTAIPARCRPRWRGAHIASSSPPPAHAWRSRPRCSRPRSACRGGSATGLAGRRGRR